MLPKHRRKSFSLLLLFQVLCYNWRIKQTSSEITVLHVRHLLVTDNMTQLYTKTDMNRFYKISRTVRDEQTRLERALKADALVHMC